MSDTFYVCMDLHRWENCELDDVPIGSFFGPDDGSVGFLTVYADIDTAKAANTNGVELVKIEN